MLDDDHGVPLISQVLKALQKHRVVARVQPDRRLVEDVEHPDQPTADLSRQPNPLRLAARKRRGGAVQREVIQTAPQQEAQPPANLLEGLARDQLLRLVELEGLEELKCVFDGEGADLREGEGGGMA